MKAMTRMLARIAVTGAAGFIGSHVVERFLQRKDVKFVLGIDNLTTGSIDNVAGVGDKRFQLRNMDVRDFDELSIVLRRYRIDALIHLATLPLVFSLQQSREASSAILEMQISALEALKSGHCRYLLSFSTSEVYGSRYNTVLTEEDVLAPQTPYAAAKAGGDMLTMAYARSFGLDCSVIRPFNNYGPRKRVLAGAGIIPTAISRIYEGIPVEIQGDGSAARDFVFVTDTADAVVAATFDQMSSGELIQVANQSPRTVLEIVTDIGRLIGREPKIIHTPARAADVGYLCGSGAKAKRLLGFSPTVSWEDGLRKCIDYYTSAGNTA